MINLIGILFQEAKLVTDKLASLSLDEITTFENELKVMS